MELEILNGMITGRYHNLFPHGLERASQESSFHVCGVTAGGQPCGYLRFVLPPETMLMSVIRTTTGDHGDVWDPCCGWRPSVLMFGGLCCWGGPCWIHLPWCSQRPCGCPWSVQPRETMWSPWSELLMVVVEKEASVTVVSMTPDS